MDTGPLSKLRYSHHAVDGRRQSFAQAAAARDSERVVTSLRDVRITRWIVLDQPRRFQVSTQADGEEIVARLVEDKDEASLSQGTESLGDAIVELSSRYPNPPAALPALANSHPVELPYSSGAVFHGPAFQLLRSLRYGDGGSTATLDAAGAPFPSASCIPRSSTASSTQSQMTISESGTWRLRTI